MDWPSTELCKLDRGLLAYDSIDPTDPPQFDSQATYLDRPGLLTVTECERLAFDAFESERIKQHRYPTGPTMPGTRGKEG